MDKSRKKKAFRPGGYDALEERLVLSTGGTSVLAAEARRLNVTAGEQSAQLRARRFGRRALGRRQFALRQTGGGVGGGSGFARNGFNPIVASLGFTDPNTVAGALTATNTASSVVGPNLTPDTSGFVNPSLSVTSLAQAVAAGTTINNLGLNNGLSNFNGTALGNGLFSNGLGFANAQSLLGNLSSTIDSSLGLTANALNGGIVSFGGLGANTNTFGLGNPLLTSSSFGFNNTGFNGGLGLNNGLGFNTTTTTPTLGDPLGNLTPFDALGLDLGIRNTVGTPVNPTTGFDFGTGIDVDPTTGFPVGTGNGTGGTTSGTGTGTGGTGTGTGTTGTTTSQSVG